MNDLTRRCRSLIRSFPRFASEAGGVKLYNYQQQPAAAILDSIRNNLGLTIVLVLPRQSGKDELLCHLKIYLMRLLSYKDRGIVEVNPTYKPQTISAIMRIENRLQANTLTLSRWKKRSDYIRFIGMCKTSFLSGDGSANVVGATASLLLIVNEAQDISPAVYDKRFAPMAASRNATRLICGTVWTSQTLLARELRAAQAAEKQDGRRRVFFFNSKDIGKENPKYRKYVQTEVQRLGREHPFIKTQYFCEEIDSQAGMFNPGRRALMIGDQPAQELPLPGSCYAFLVDVAGQDEARLDPNNDDAGLFNAGRDSTTLSIVSVDLRSLETLQAPTYRVVHRRSWLGISHLKIFAQIKSLAETWKPQHLVIDATGVGEGLWAMLDRSFPDRVLPVKFSQASKSEIGWQFLAIIETGRFKDCALTEIVRLQYDSCTSEILLGPAKTLRWGVPEGSRSPDGSLIHDDHVLADSLVSQLDQLDWHIQSDSIHIDGSNPLNREVRL
jgi:hypothetical protein